MQVKSPTLSVPCPCRCSKLVIESTQPIPFSVDLQAAIPHVQMTLSSPGVVKLHFESLSPPPADPKPQEASTRISLLAGAESKEEEAQEESSWHEHESKEDASPVRARPYFTRKSKTSDRVSKFIAETVMPSAPTLQDKTLSLLLRDALQQELHVSVHMVRKYRQAIETWLFTRPGGSKDPRNQIKQWPKTLAVLVEFRRLADREPDEAALPHLAQPPLASIASSWRTLDRSSSARKSTWVLLIYLQRVAQMKPKQIYSLTMAQTSFDMKGWNLTLADAKTLTLGCDCQPVLNQGQQQPVPHPRCCALSIVNDFWEFRTRISMDAASDFLFLQAAANDKSLVKKRFPLCAIRTAETDLAAALATKEEVPVPPAEDAGSVQADAGNGVVPCA